jgi:hypothetical protein
MNLSFRRGSVATSSTKDTPEKDTKDDATKKESSFTFGDMGRNLLSKKIFQKDEASDAPAHSTSENADSGINIGFDFLKRSKSTTDDTPFRIAQVMALLENFRLQCPQTHAGLVVAFTATTLSPLTDADVKFKWYRMDKANDQFLQIDEGSRAWYPPTADDIGKKICAQCEDIFEQGYCRYAEVFFLIILFAVRKYDIQGWTG